MPELLGNLVDAREAFGAVLRLVPGLERERRQGEVGAGDGFPGAQRLHPRKSAPRPLQPARCLVYHEDIVDPLPQEHRSDRLPALTCAHDQHVEDPLSRGCAPLWHPARFGVFDQIEVTRHPCFQGLQSNGGRVRGHFGRSPGSVNRSRVVQYLLPQRRPTGL